jgi:enoyl-CoA hydratase
MDNLLDADLDAEAPMGPSRLALSTPVIAAVSGYAVAGGLELALWCELRLIETDAVVGLGRALDLILTGRPVAADEALAMGLANRIVAPGSARTEAERLASQIAAFPQACLRSDRRSVYETLGQRRKLARELELGLATIRAGTEVARFAAGEGRGGHFDP